MSRVNDEPGVIERTITVVDGAGYADFDATGEAHCLIIVARDRNTNPTISWLLTDWKGRGITGDGPQTGPEINWPFINGKALIRGACRLTLSDVSVDGIYDIAIYGVGRESDWNAN